MRRLKRMSLRQRIALMISILLIVSVTLIGGIVYFQARKMIVDSIGTQASKIAETAVSMIDPVQYKELLKNGDDQSPYYDELREKLYDLREKTGVLYLYTMQKVGGKYLFMVDGELADDASQFGEEEDPSEITDLMERAFAGEKIIGDLDNSPEWGQLLSAFVPIKGTKGENLGFVGVDFVAKDIFALLERSINMIIIILAVILVLSLGVAYLLARSISVPLEELAEISAKVRDGNLAVQLKKIDREDEIGRLYLSFGDMIAHLRSLVEKIQVRYDKLLAGVNILEESATSTEKSMTYITTSVNDVAIGSENQVENLSDTMTEVTNISVHVCNVEENSKQATKLSDQAEERAEVGRDSLKNAKSQISQINYQANQSAEIIRSLGSQITEVTGFVKIIRDIAQQTNLLALNAAIESARAGEEGRGFAVVAQEIRVLAEESATAAENVTRTIQLIQEQSAGAVEAIIKTVDEVKGGVIAIDNAEEQFETVLAANHTVGKNIAQVAEAIQSVNYVFKQIKQSMEGVSALSEEANATAEEVAAMVEEEQANVERVRAQSEILVDVARELEEEIQKFRL